jgi:hypothetical protein
MNVVNLLSDSCLITEHSYDGRVSLGYFVCQYSLWKETGKPEKTRYRALTDSFSCKCHESIARIEPMISEVKGSAVTTAPLMPRIVYPSYRLPPDLPNEA